MALYLRKSNERGQANHGWLNSQHTFSFADYYDENHMGFKSLRVINEDRILGGMGFGAHPHKNMEIISYVVNGGLKHKDSMGNECLIKPYEVQIMSAGTGVVHSEMNAEIQKETHFFQIWILPQVTQTPPSYGQKSFKENLLSYKKTCVVSPTGENGSLVIKQNAWIYIQKMKAQQKESIFQETPTHYWLQVIKGQIHARELTLNTGDALRVENDVLGEVVALEESEVILFKLAP